jgi:hypothetical protein
MSRFKNNLKNVAAMAACFAAVCMMFAGCEKDDMDNVKADWFDGKITAKLEKGDSYNSEISTVYALVNATVSGSGQLNGISMGQGAYANGGFTLTLPETMNNAHLMGIQTYFSHLIEESGAVEYSAPEARVNEIKLFAISGSEYLDAVTYVKPASNRTTCLFLYADCDVNVTAGKNVNVVLRQGWNRMYMSSGKLTSKAPSGMKWYLNKDVK